MIKLSRSQEVRASNLHKKSIVVDNHSDIPGDVLRRRKLKNEKKVLERIHVPKLIAGGVSASLATVWSDSGSFARALNLHQPTLVTLLTIDCMKQEFDESSNVITCARTAKAIKQAKKDGKIAFLLHIEGGKPICDDIAYIRTLYELGVRSIGLTWNPRNLIANGVGERSDCGLSDFGVEVINEANRLGMVIDVSHLSKGGFWDVLENSKDPIVASHSNARSVCDHSRNLSDEQIKALTEKGGVMGMNFYPEFVDSEHPSLERVLDHIDYIADLVGVDYIGIGADFIDYMAYYGDPLVQSFIEGHPYPQGLENTSRMYNITRGLISRGYSDQEIEKILGANFLRVYERVFGS